MEEGKRDLAASVLDTNMTALMLAAKSNADSISAMLIKAKVNLGARNRVRLVGMQSVVSVCCVGCRHK